MEADKMKEEATATPKRTLRTGRIVPDQFGNKMMIIEDIEEGSSAPSPTPIRGI
jgi:hypothetical protein